MNQFRNGQVRNHALRTFIINLFAHIRQKVKNRTSGNRGKNCKLSGNNDFWIFFVVGTYRAEDVYKNLPKTISVYRSSKLRLGSSQAYHRLFKTAWYFNGRSLKQQ